MHLSHSYALRLIYGKTFFAFKNQTHDVWRRSANATSAWCCPPILILYLPGQPFLNFCAYSSVSGLNHPGIKFWSKSLMPEVYFFMVLYVYKWLFSTSILTTNAQTIKRKSLSLEKTWTKKPVNCSLLVCASRLLDEFPLPSALTPNKL